MAFTKKDTIIELLELTTPTEIKRYASTILPKVYNGYSWQPLAFTHDAIELSQEATSGNLKIKVSSIFRDRKELLNFNNDINVRLFLLKNGEYYKTIFEGYIASTTLSTNTLELSCNHILAGTALTIPEKMYAGNCQHALYGAGCNINKADFTKNGLITATDPDTPLRKIKLNFSTDVPMGGNLQLGTIKNLRTGEHKVIKDELAEDSGQFWVMMGSPFIDVKAGDAFEFYYGCDKQRKGNCRNRFNNEINFFGFDRIPGSNPFKDPLK